MCATASAGCCVSAAPRDIVNDRPVLNRDALANPDTLDVIAALEALRV